MSRTPELSQFQREIAVKLIRGLVLEHDASSVALARAMIEAGYDRPGQQAISGIMHRFVQSGRGIAENVAQFIGQDFDWYFVERHPAVYGDIPKWPESEKTAKASTRGSAYAPSSFYAVKHKIIRTKQVPNITSKILLDLTADFESHASQRTQNLVGTWIQNDTRASPHASTSRIRTSGP